MAAPPPGAGRPGDEPGRRRFLEIGDLPLESGEILPDTVLAFETWGELSPQRDNAVLVLHALTGDSHVTGEAGPGLTGKMRNTLTSVLVGLLPRI